MRPSSVGVSAVRVLVVGPDGTGKTTLLDAVEATLSERGHSTRRMHFDPRAIQDSARSVPDPQAQVPRGATGQIASVLARAANYLLARRGEGGLLRRDVQVLFQERGWYDQAVDPARYRLGAGPASMLVKALGPLVAPRYDLVVLCTGDALAINARKPELDVSEIERQIGAWRSLVSKRRVIDVDTTALSKVEAAAAVLDRIDAARASCLARRFARVFPVPARLELRATPHARTSAASLYQPGRRWARLSKRLMTRLPGWHDVRSNDPLAKFAHLLCRSDGVAFDRLAAIRSHGRQRMVASLERDGRIVAFAKYSWGDDVGSLQHEQEGMKRAGIVEGFVLPEVIKHVREPEGEILLLRAYEHVERSVDLETVVAAAVALSRCADGRGLTHGDLAPWNLLASDPPVILDWEMWEPDFRPYADIGYCLGEMVRLGQVPLSAAAAALRTYTETCSLPPPDALELPEALRPALELWKVATP